MVAVVIIFDILYKWGTGEGKEKMKKINIIRLLTIVICVISMVYSWISFIKGNRIPGLISILYSLGNCIPSKCFLGSIWNYRFFLIIRNYIDGGLNQWINIELKLVDLHYI
jgi:isoprenylcysteine carboxyl methyltransferase (ICMT) family protein YpbQ